MKQKIPLLLFAVFVICSCAPKGQSEPTASPQTENDTYFHYSIWWAFVNKVFDAKLSVAEMQKKGIR